MDNEDQRIEVIRNMYLNDDETIEIDTVELPGADPSDAIWLRTMGNSTLGYVGVYESRRTLETVCTKLFPDQKSCERQLLIQEAVIVNPDNPEGKEP